MMWILCDPSLCLFVRGRLVGFSVERGSPVVGTRFSGTNSRGAGRNDPVRVVSIGAACRSSWRKSTESDAQMERAPRGDSGLALAHR